jgi:ATP-binding cassette subfamily B protein
MADCQNATDMVRAKTLVERLGWEHPLRERGNDLSVGEGQLLTFARAMAHDPLIVIMDEATASIDSVTEQLIQEATTAIMETKTAIVIAHRLSTIQGADRILVMDKGSIVESGTHEELMERNGAYAELVAASEAAVGDMATSA